MLNLNLDLGHLTLVGFGLAVIYFLARLCFVASGAQETLSRWLDEREYQRVVRINRQAAARKASEAKTP